MYNNETEQMLTEKQMTDLDQELVPEELSKALYQMKKR